MAKGFFKPRITALSYTRIKAWETCPAQAKYKHVDKIPEPDSPYAARGTELHAQAAQYLKTGGVCPPALSRVGLVLDKLRTEVEDLQTELQVAFDRDWNSVDWFAPNVYMRVIFDAAGLASPTRLIIVDHKSGKDREEHDDQMELYGISGFKKWPDVKLVDVRLIYIDQGYQRGMQFKRKMLPEMEERWTGRCQKILDDTEFVATPGRYCRYCHYRRSNKGPCQYG